MLQIPQIHGLVGLPLNVMNYKEGDCIQRMPTIKKCKYGCEVDEQSKK